MTDLDMPQRLQAWSYHRQRLGRAAADPAEVLRDVVAVYSSHPTAPLALLCRSRTLDAAQFQAMEERREALRLPAMRRSIFLVPAETAARLVAATREPIEKRTRNLAYGGMNWESYAHLKERMLEHAQQPVSSSELKAAIETDANLNVALGTMARELLLLRLGGNLRTDSLRFVSTEAWLGRPLEEADADASLTWLAEGYLRGYGPARVEDFAWWSGVTRRRAQAALGGVDTVDMGGGLLLPADLQVAFKRVKPVDPDVLDLLPKWDAYTMGYPSSGRGRFLSDEHLSSAYSKSGQGTGATSGDGLPLLLRGGRAVGTWSHRLEGSRMRVTVTPFAGCAVPSALDEHTFDEVGRLLGATSVTVDVAGA